MSVRIAVDKQALKDLLDAVTGAGWEIEDMVAQARLQSGPIQQLRRDYMDAVEVKQDD